MISKENYDRRKTENDAERKKNIAERWSKIKDPMIWFNGLLVVATFTLAWIAYKTDQTLHLQQRAWVSPYSAAPIIFKETPTKMKEINVSAQIQDVGNAPAFNAVHYFQLVRFKPIINTKTNQLGGFGENDTCNGLEPIPGSHTMFPSSSSWEDSKVLRDAWTNAIYDDAIQNLTDVFAVKGCVKYDTTIKDRITRFCFYLGPPAGLTIADVSKTPISSWRWYFCESGNYAD